MHLVPDETTLVVAGAWNPAILTPEWFLRNGLRRPAGEQIRVQVQTPVGAGLVVDVPRFTIEGITMVARPDALILIPAGSFEAATLGRIESAARHVLEALNHTPIGGVGYNFEFIDEEPADPFLEPFTRANLSMADHLPDGWAVNGTGLMTSYVVGEAQVNVQRQYRDNQLAVKFNFHYGATSAGAAAGLLDGSRMAANYRTALQLVQAIYGDLRNENEPEAAAIP
jgi:hypothetical protein